MKTFCSSIKKVHVKSDVITEDRKLALMQKNTREVFFAGGKS